MATQDVGKGGGKYKRINSELVGVGVQKLMVDPIIFKAPKNAITCPEKRHLNRKFQFHFYCIDLPTHSLKDLSYIMNVYI